MIPTEVLKEKLVNTYFTGDMFGTVEVLYKSEETGGLASFMFDYSRDELMRQSLEHAGVDEETLVSNTIERRRLISKAKSDEVLEAAKKLSQNMIEENKKKMNVMARKMASEITNANNKQEKAKLESEIYDNLKEKNSDSYELFKIKVWILKQPETKKSNAPDLREKISNSETVLECLSLYNEVLKEGNEENGDL